MGRATFASRIGQSPKLAGRRMSSSGFQPRVSADQICGHIAVSSPIAGPTPIGHEYCGLAEELGREVRNVKPGQFVVGSFAVLDNNCVICRNGYQSSCVQRDFMSEAQAGWLRFLWQTARW